MIVWLALLLLLPLATAAGEPEGLLRAHQAFVLSLGSPDRATAVARWRIAPGYYLYRDSIDVEVIAPAGVRVAALEKPPGTIKTDRFFGRQSVYYDSALATARLTSESDTPTLVVARVRYQGCAEVGVCFPPQEQTLSLTLAAESSGGATTAAAGPPRFSVAEQDRVAGLLVSQGPWALPAFFGFGLLLAFTPCVFPMVPILSGLIVGSGGHTARGHALRLSLVYVLAMAGTYTAAGMLAAVLGQGIQAWFQEPWVIAAFSVLFVLLALSMFGLYTLQLPVSWQTRLTGLGNRQRGGSYLGAGLMGLLSALVVGPCVAAPLIGVLSVIATTGDVVLGGTALFALSLGMGAPLLVIGASAEHVLPRAGRWMAPIKTTLGVLLLAVAVWMLERIVPATVAMVLWASLFLGAGAWLCTRPLPERGVAIWRVLGRTLALAALAYAAVLMVGVAAGGRDPWQPLRGTPLDGGEVTGGLVFQPVSTVTDLERVLGGGRPAMLAFSAQWCISCKEMERYTYSDPGVRTALAGTTLLSADVTAHDEQDRVLLGRFGVIGPPALLFFDAAGNEIPALRRVGFVDAAALRRVARTLETAPGPCGGPDAQHKGESWPCTSAVRSSRPASGGRDRPWCSEGSTAC